MTALPTFVPGLRSRRDTPRIARCAQRSGLRVAFPVVACALAFVHGCAGPHLRAGRFEDRTVAYDVGEPGEGWREVKLETANVAWYNDELRASLLVNSHCEGVQDTPLEGLTSDLLAGMTDREFLSQQKLPWSRREALESVAIAKLDGVPRQLSVFVLKKDGCVYDIVLDARPETHGAAQTAFKRVRDGFNVEARKDRGGS